MNHVRSQTLLSAARWVAAACLLVAFTAHATAAPQDLMQHVDNAPPISIVMDQVIQETPAGYGFIGFTLHNQDKSAHTVTLSIKYSAYGAEPVSVQRTITLPVNSKQTATLPSTPFADYGRLQVTIDGVDITTTHISSSSSNNASTVLIAASRDTARLTRALEETLRRAPTRSPQTGRHRTVVRQNDDVTTIAPALLPDHWAMLTTFRALVISATDPAITAAHQRLLADYVGGGGHLWILAGNNLPAGPLQTITDDAFVRSSASKDADGLRSGRYGFGHWLVASNAFTAAFESGEHVQQLSEHTAPSTTHWPQRFAKELLAPLAVPGIGDLPVRLFIVVIVVFVLAVGPLAYTMLRRRRRLILLFVLIPTTGFATTVGILTYGVFSEGLATQTTTVSVTLLDQRHHVASTASGRSVFAGLAIAKGLRPGAATTVLPTETWSPRPRWDMDLSNGWQLLGGAVPARTMNGYFAASHARARERLRFKRTPTGGYDVLADDGFVPTELVAHLHDGSLWTLDGDQLKRATPKAAAALLTEFSSSYKSALAATQIRKQSRRSRRRWSSRSTAASTAATIDLVPWIERELGIEVEKTPGLYVAVVARNPSVDDLGLGNTEEELSLHLIVGRLAEDDIVD